MAEMKANREGSGKALMARLEAHPELMARVKRILDWAEDTGGEVFRAAEAEERAIREIKALGQEVLMDWAKRLAEETSKQAAKAG
jgi:undecaprenyl pyrophosphate synthase